MVTVLHAKMKELWNWQFGQPPAKLPSAQSPIAQSPIAQSPKPGLYTYRLRPASKGQLGRAQMGSAKMGSAKIEPDGGRTEHREQRRVHLRVEADGNAAMFVDAMDVIHLNATAATLVYWALEGVTRQKAAARLVARYGKSSQQRFQSDLTAMYAMIERLSQSELGCPTCAIHDLQAADLFTVAPSAPYKADLALTYKCNNDCPHCYNEAERLELDSLSLDEWKRVVDRLVDVGVPHLILTGGEATLYPELSQLIQYADSRGPIVGMNSNGRRFSYMDFAKSMKQCGLNHLQVTLGSHQPDVHNRMMNAVCFDQTIRGIRNAIDAGIHTITNTTLMQMNKDEIEDTIAFLHDLGVRTFAVNGMIYSGGGFHSAQSIAESEMPASLIRVRDKAAQLGMNFLWYTPTQYCRLSPVELEIGAKRCNAGEYSICVEPNADVLPCQSYYVSAGNILRDAWEEIWSSQLFTGFRDRGLNPERYGLPEKCWECPDLPLCGGGCRIEREAADGIRIADGTGCSSGGCSSGGCSSGGCGSGGSMPRTQDTPHHDAIGFVPLDQIFLPHGSPAIGSPAIGSHGPRRGTGQFAAGSDPNLP